MIRSKTAVLLMSVLILPAIAASTARAQELTGTLKKLKDTSVITIGTPDYKIPFSYLDDNQQHVGYSIDLCTKIAAELQKTLGLAKLEIKTRSVTTATRIPLLQNGTIDISCDSATITERRKQQVSFAPADFISTTRLVAKKSSNIHSLADMKGKTVVSTAGASNLEEIIALNKSQNLGMTILTSKDHIEGFLMVETGRATAFAMDDILIAALIASSKTPNDYAMNDAPLSTIEPSGDIMRLDDAPFTKAVTDATTAIFKSKEIYAIYNKWFTSPIPPKGINLNFPIGDALKAAYSKPTNSADPNDYK